VWVPVAAATPQAQSTFEVGPSATTVATRWLDYGSHPTPSRSASTVAGSDPAGRTSRRLRSRNCAARCTNPTGWWIGMSLTAGGAIPSVDGDRAVVARSPRRGARN
jgi:hypothetical protein